MTTEGTAPELLRSHPGRGLEQALSACDRLLEEIGRRVHMFAWLRAPSGEAWLAVDAYYPGNRVVVICRSEPGPHDELYRREVPAHGLRLLELGPGELEGTPASRDRIAQLVGALAPVARPHDEAAQREPRPSPVLAALRPATGAEATRVARMPVRPPPPLTTEAFVAGGVIVGVLMVLVLGLECYGAVLALGAGHVLLAFGVALDAIARALGATAAGRAREAAWLWGCALVGSPAVASFATFDRSEAPLPEPAPLAGLLALVALGVLALALIAGALGI